MCSLAPYGQPSPVLAERVEVSRALQGGVITLKPVPAQSHLSPTALWLSDHRLCIYHTKLYGGSKKKSLDEFDGFMKTFSATSYGSRGEPACNPWIVLWVLLGARLLIRVLPLSSSS